MSLLIRSGGLYGLSSCLIFEHHGRVAALKCGEKRGTFVLTLFIIIYLLFIF